MRADSASRCLGLGGENDSWSASSTVSSSRSRFILTTVENSFVLFKRRAGFAKILTSSLPEMQLMVRLRSGQTSTFEVDSSSTVAAFKAQVAAAAILEIPESSLLYLGKVLDDEATLEACGVGDGGCLVQAAAAAVAFESPPVPTTATLYDRIKHNVARGIDVDYDVPSWHIDYVPYAKYVPPKDGKPQIQAAAYEPDGDQAWRRDYYVSGPGNQNEVNRELNVGLPE